MPCNARSAIPVRQIGADSVCLERLNFARSKKQQARQNKDAEKIISHPIVGLLK
jgi:hypothetical protein